ncbi:hypothetical protein DYB32_000524 [Aphanomyces invadans]|uniref:Uncharacterized protein n=1 Tax=Aphanomyces invadans TaxID=157072 RepID=A0A3R6WTT7_9STRA|nr:hypothetical protein DYB32_000524 [Aphanomyces invadans]
MQQWAADKRSQAAALRQKGKCDEAITAYTTALEMDQEDVESFVGRGALYLELKRTDVARRDMESALKLQPSHSGALELQQNVHAAVAASMEVAPRQELLPSGKDSDRLRALLEMDIRQSSKDKKKDHKKEHKKKEKKKHKKRSPLELPLNQAVHPSEVATDNDITSKPPPSDGLASYAMFVKWVLLSPTSTVEAEGSSKWPPDLDALEEPALAESTSPTFATTTDAKMARASVEADNEALVDTLFDLEREIEAFDAVLAQLEHDKAMDQGTSSDKSILL